MSLLLETARHQWADADRRVREAAAEPRRHERLLTLTDAILEELRRRLGQVFTLEELATLYAGADRWTYELAGTGLADLATATDAAFYLYARGATDFRP